MVTCQPSKKRPNNATWLPDDIEVCPWKLAIDTREQTPWTFQEMVLGQKQIIVQRETKTMVTGDYSIVGYEKDIVIERKSAADFLGSIGSGHARFQREHERLRAIVENGGYACVIIEGDLASICDELDNPDSGRRITSSLAKSLTSKWPRTYRVPWIFAGDRRRAEEVGFLTLWNWWKDQQNI